MINFKFCVRFLIQFIKFICKIESICLLQKTIAHLKKKKLLLVVYFVKYLKALVMFSDLKKKLRNKKCLWLCMRWFVYFHKFFHFNDEVYNYLFISGQIDEIYNWCIVNSSNILFEIPSIIRNKIKRNRHNIISLLALCGW